MEGYRTANEDREWKLGGRAEQGEQGPQELIGSGKNSCFSTGGGDNNKMPLRVHR